MELLYRSSNFLFINFLFLEKNKKLKLIHPKVYELSLVRRWNALPPNPPSHYVKRYSAGLSALWAWTSRSFLIWPVKSCLLSHFSHYTYWNKFKSLFGCFIYFWLRSVYYVDKYLLIDLVIQPPPKTLSPTLFFA